MVATAKQGMMTFVGQATGKTYNKEIYVSDVSLARINFDSGAGATATSENFFRCPEDVVLVDYAQVTGTADTEKLQLTRNGVPTGDILRYESYLSSLNSRPPLAIGFAAGDDVSAIQIAD